MDVKHQGRCWFRRQRSADAKANGGGQKVTPKAKKPRVAKQTAADRVREAKATFDEVVLTAPTETCEFSIRIVRPGVDISYKGTTIDGLKSILSSL